MKITIELDKAAKPDEAEEQLYKALTIKRRADHASEFQNPKLRALAKRMIHRYGALSQKLSADLLALLEKGGPQ